MIKKFNKQLPWLAKAGGDEIQSVGAQCDKFYQRLEWLYLGFHSWFREFCHGQIGEKMQKKMTIYHA
jgi:hypothetical protein